MKIYSDIKELIGNTPLFRPAVYNERHAGGANILCKLEYLNPAGSTKDRAALYMIEDAEAKGLLAPGATIIEPTSGNTGIGLAAIATSRGYRVVLTMPDTMSVERRTLLAAYGAQIVLTPGDSGMKGAIEKAEELAKQTPGSFIPGQFENEANARAHYETTGPEIWRDTEGKVDVLIAGVGTGGTLTGCGEYLKAQNPDIKVVAVEPAGSPLLSGGKAGSHGLQGIGANFIPSLLNREIYDDVFPVTEEEAYVAAQALAREQGILVGISSGAALFAATVLSCEPAYEGKTIVVILPDTGDRYLSTPLYGPDPEEE
ncbi:MAG: cysteine synthase A [Clostridia bacterium]|nr:cysteine synthase A [Clostridia bacterium]